MKNLRALSFSFVMVLAAALTTEPADAQGRGRSRGDGEAPPGWCRGRGNPHNTSENCGSSRNGTQGRRDRRYTASEDAHRAFHREHDRICRERASQRPFDLRWQLQVRSECRAAHERWHAIHDPYRRY
ncbi:MAG TPA: hypothetical protein VHG28_12365 [Longimicrobiaceae bacterium]|nr:hypothetical protein [Longimicrobiaceae bacterium]